MNGVDDRAKESVGEGEMPQEAVYEVVNQPFFFVVTRNVSEGEAMVIVLYALVENHAGEDHPSVHHVEAYLAP